MALNPEPINPPPPPLQILSTATATVADHDHDHDYDTPYWDAAAMGALSPASLAAVARLRAYAPPPFPIWSRMPPRRRGAVLILLYPDRHGALRVVITMRAAGLRTFPNQAALPGGKSDSVDETPYQTARREAWEEIGLPATDAEVPAPFRIRHLCDLPHHLARTDVIVRPCVALLDVDPGFLPALGEDEPLPLVEETLVPRLDAREVAAVFSAPFEDFLSANETPRRRPEGSGDAKQSKYAPPPGYWYDGTWTMHQHERWRIHNFYVPVDRQRVARPGSDVNEGEGGGGKLGVGPDLRGQQVVVEGQVGGEGEGKDEEEVQLRYKVWGMTAHVLVDAARVAYGRDPEQEHNPHLGDEALICVASEAWEWLKGKPDEEPKM
jgi:coenzyme A diphosphatase NUDT7